jgi:hypothetical protein
VDICSELWGEKQFSLKPPLATPEIAWSHESISQGHINRRLRKELVLLGSTSEFRELGESRQLTARYPMCEAPFFLAPGHNEGHIKEK